MSEYHIVTQNELYHHGILGQKWGIRRFQNKDGSLTAEGRKRYEYSSEEIKNEAIKQIETHGTDKLDEYTQKSNALEVELAEDYKNYYKKLLNDEHFQNEIWDKLHDDFGNGVDDEELYELVLDEILGDAINKHVPKDIKDKQIELYTNLDNYYAEARKISNELLDRVGDVPVQTFLNTTKNLSTVSENFILNNLKDAAWNSYVYKHFDDYWVYDVEERYDIDKLFNLDKYHKRFGS